MKIYDKLHLENYANLEEKSLYFLMIIEIIESWIYVDGEVK